MSKNIKIEIKHRIFGSVLFEYECEDNTLRKTVEAAARKGVSLCGADLRDANLRDADLCDADLRGADLRGCVLDYNDNRNGYGNTDDLIRRINDSSNLRPTVVYENHDAFSSRWGAFWRNLIIIREWKVVEKARDLRNILNNEHKAVLRAFAKVNNITKVEFRDNDDEGCEFVGKHDDGRTCILGLSTPISGLVSGAEYTLEDLGIEL